MSRVLSALRRLEGFFGAEDDPQEPAYDPVHLGGVLISFLVVIGALYWLLWTLLVYEGGLFVKLRAGLNVLLGFKTLKDYGYQASPYAMGVFEGWVGNVLALALAALAAAALHRLYGEASRHARKK